MYISSVLQPPHSSCAISVPSDAAQRAQREKACASRLGHAFSRRRVKRATDNAPAGGTGVMPLHCRKNTQTHSKTRPRSGRRQRQSNTMRSQPGSQAQRAPRKRALRTYAPARSARSTRPAAQPKRDGWERARCSENPPRARGALASFTRCSARSRTRLGIKQQRAAARAYDLALRSTATCARDATPHGRVPVALSTRQQAHSEYGCHVTGTYRAPPLLSTAGGGWGCCRKQAAQHAPPTNSPRRRAQTTTATCVHACAHPARALHAHQGQRRRREGGALL
jgi:hypothetical protein